ncbi:MAG: PQQ-binding-like beta-propeller repeat protein [Actinomycetia bacterium]|nr:PQQ-binding-like beta-propeller repeat protein [Actinomycetes bacterium]
MSAAITAPRSVAVIAFACLFAGCVGDGGVNGDDAGGTPTTVESAPTSTSTSTTSTTSSVPPDLSQVAPEPDGTLSPPAGVRRPWSATVPGLLTFRGNPTRSYYGKGPVPAAPEIRWTYPASGAMCADSTVGDETKQWCGTGWTGQPAVFNRDGRQWVVFGAYDRAVHFVDSTDGSDILTPFATGDLIKGSVTVDPDGFPLVYTGSRDNHFRVLAIDRGGEAVELWRLSATDVGPTLWNNDWDGSALVLDDWLIVGGENSQLHVVQLNRGYDAEGRVTVAPQLIFNTPGWDDQVIADLAGNRANEMSIENSVAVWGDTVYFANSGGLVQGWDLAPLRMGGTPTRTFRFWTGDDTDASVVIDEDGFLYVAVEFERANAQGRFLGQLMKLDPRRPDDPYVWSYKDQGDIPAGFWATPALLDTVVIAPTDGGEVLALDRMTGEKLWSFELTGPTWQSPVVVDEKLVQGDCNGTLHGYDVSNERIQPPELWSVDVGGCIESTPALWEGRLFVGTRGGRFFSLGDITPP